MFFYYGILTSKSSSSISKSNSSNFSYSDFIIYGSLAVDYLDVSSSSKLGSESIESIIAESATMIA